MTFAEVHVKRSVILTDRLGADILLVLTMSTHCQRTKLGNAPSRCRTSFDA